MKNEIPITITRAVFFLLFSLFFFGTIATKAQNINKLTKDNKRTGIWKKYYTNKRIRYEGTFIDGKEVGVFKYYDITTSKHPTIIKEFSKKTDSAKVSYFNLDGKLRTKGVMIGKKRVGKWIYFFPNQKLFSEEYYVDGKLEGKLINYYNNGKVLEITEYSKAGAQVGSPAPDKGHDRLAARCTVDSHIVVVDKVAPTTLRFFSLEINT